MKKNQKYLEQEYAKTFDEYSDAIFRHCFFRVSHTEVARDITQDAFIKVWQYLILGGEILNMKAFLYKTANNLIIDYYRKKKSESLDTLCEDGFDPIGDTAEQITDRAEVNQALAVLEKLPSDDRDILVMRYVDDLTIEEIADALDQTQNAVSVRIHRALEKAKKIFTP